MKTIKIKIDNIQGRQNMVVALAYQGYKVWIEKYVQNETYWVCFEIEESSIQDVSVPSVAKN